MSRQDANATFALTSFLYGGNAAYIEDLYAKYEANPDSVDAEWQSFFQSLKDDPASVTKSAKGASWRKPLSRSLSHLKVLGLRQGRGVSLGAYMQRREFITIIGGATVVLTCATVKDPSKAQTVRRKRLAYLSGGSKSGSPYTLDILKASLRDLGWRENETIDIDERWAEGDNSRLARLASELVQLHPDVIATTGGSEAKALQFATRDIPIVFHMVADPVSSGLVASISRPGGNTTGFAQGPQFLWSKRLSLLTEMLGRQPRNLA